MNSTMKGRLAAFGLGALVSIAFIAITGDQAGPGIRVGDILDIDKIGFASGRVQVTEIRRNWIRVSYEFSEGEELHGAVTWVNLDSLRSVVVTARESEWGEDFAASNDWVD